MANLIDGIRAALATFTDELRSLRGQIEKLQVEREDLLAQPAAKADITAVMHQWVDAQRGLFLKSFAQRLKADLERPGLDLTDPARIQRHVASNFYGITSSSNGSSDAKAIDCTLAGLFGGLLKSAISTAIDEMPWPDSPGLPMAERRKRIGAIDKQLDVLKAKERDLVQAAAQARITID